MEVTMRWFLTMLVLSLLGACRSPAWTPGDEPLAIYAPDDRSWAAVEEGCARWAVSTLVCRRTAYRGESAVHVSIDSIADADATTNWFQSPTGDEFRMTLDSWLWTPDAGDDYRYWVAAHEVGHLLGVWDHTEEPNTLMFHFADAPGPTTVDLDALADVWGEAPWEG
jgi:hypothetical protein